jgi:hypothetical protein
MIEIKVPSGRKITGIPKNGYYWQMQVQMEVCDLDTCFFVECNIKEYEDYSEYKNDKYDSRKLTELNILPDKQPLDHVKVPDCRRNSFGLEKGMIGVYNFEEAENVGDYKFIYPDFSLTTKDMKKFLTGKKKEFKKEGKKFEIHYWYLETSSIIEVPRDKNLWRDWDVTNKLIEAWGKVEYHRENGVDKLLKKKTKNKRKTQKPPKIEEENMVSLDNFALDISDDDVEIDDSGYQSDNSIISLDDFELDLGDDIEMDMEEVNEICEVPTNKLRRVKIKVIYN